MFEQMGAEDFGPEGFEDLSYEGQDGLEHLAPEGPDGFENFSPERLEDVGWAGADLAASASVDGDWAGSLAPEFTGKEHVFSFLQYNPLPGGFDVHQMGAAAAPPDLLADLLEALGLEVRHVELPSWVKQLDSDGLIGSPEQDVQFWQQQTTAFTCAIQAQRGIIELFTGQKISEAQLVYEAVVNGWLTDQGTPIEHVGKLLELHGVSCHTKIGATIEDLIMELAQGRKVIVAVDSDELWYNSPLNDFFKQAADHAIWVTGVDLTDPANPKVIINDSGDPHGAGKAYDLALFVDAWADSGFHYVATDSAPPDMSFALDDGFDPIQGFFKPIVDYFSGVFSDFAEAMTHRLADPTPISVPEIATLFTDAAIRNFVNSLSKSPLTTMNESSVDMLFRVI